MNKFGLLLGALLVASPMAMHAQIEKSIKINEVMTNNSASLQDEYGQNEAWIEIANVSHTTYNIRGMYITTDRSVLDKQLSVPERVSKMSIIPNGEPRTSLSARNGCQPVVCPSFRRQCEVGCKALRRCYPRYLQLYRS